MPLIFHKYLLTGRHQALTLAPIRRGESLGLMASRIAALSLLGKIEEAEALFAKLESKPAAEEAITVSRFFLGIGLTRKSDYPLARRTFAGNAENKNSTPLERFYMLQGRVFYSYYTGRVRAALEQAKQARALALRTGDLFARFLATDAYGHCRVVAGEIHLGMRLLEEARELALELGNSSLANASAISLELYDAEFGLSGKAAVEKLERRFDSLGTEDNYSLANVGLELARQFSRQGRFQDAGSILERSAPSIYANQNRRQEIQLNLRLAELAFRRGDFFNSRHQLQFLRRLLHNEADGSFELAAVGLERKLALAENREEEAASLLECWKILARDFANTRDDNLRVRLGLLRPERENQEDRVHLLLQRSRLARSLSERLRPLLEHNLLGEVAVRLNLQPGKPMLALLPDGLGFLLHGPQGIQWQSAPFTPLQSKILRLLSRGSCKKETLVEHAWGYRYDPLRHDPVVYAAMSTLRRSLGAGAEWLQATEIGYRFTAEIQLPKVITAAKRQSQQELPPIGTPGSGPASLSQLNHRQIEILEWLQSERFLAVGLCRARFQVSEITALRDLSGLLRQGLVVRIGNARATRYSLPPPGASL